MLFFPHFSASYYLISLSTLVAKFLERVVFDALFFTLGGFLSYSVGFCFTSLLRLCLSMSAMTFTLAHPVVSVVTSLTWKQLLIKLPALPCWDHSQPWLLWPHPLQFPSHLPSTCFAGPFADSSSCIGPRRYRALQSLSWDPFSFLSAYFAVSKSIHVHSFKYYCVSNSPLTALFRTNKLHF